MNLFKLEMNIEVKSSSQLTAENHSRMVEENFTNQAVEIHFIPSS